MQGFLSLFIFRTPGAGAVIRDEGEIKDRESRVSGTTPCAEDFRRHMPKLSDCSFITASHAELRDAFQYNHRGLSLPLQQPRKNIAAYTLSGKRRYPV